MKVALLFSDDANQRALAHRLAREVPVDAIIVCKPRSGSVQGGFAKLARLARGVTGFPLRKAWFGMMAHYDRLHPDWPIPPAARVSDVNDAAVRTFIADTRPELVLVSGTNLLKQPLIELINKSAKVMNLHTGISPFVRGAPNCTNWCLATGKFELIGNSVMWIDEGIDSGDLVATEQTPLDGIEGLTALHIRVMDHAHDLLIRCAALFVAKKPLPNVPQRDFGPGRLYLSRHWNALAAAKAVANFYLRFGRRKEPGEQPVLVDPQLP